MQRLGILTFVSRYGHCVAGPLALCKIIDHIDAATALAYSRIAWWTSCESLTLDQLENNLNADKAVRGHSTWLHLADGKDQPDTDQ